MRPIPGLVYDSPNRFTFKQRALLAIAPPVFAISLKALMSTCRIELRCFDQFQQSLAGGRHVILALWHESLAMAAYVFRNTGYHTIASYSFDGEMGVRVLARMGLFAVRGSSSRGGSEAVAGLCEAAKHVPLIGFTLDGPRGPRREAKPGIGVIAARTGLPVYPAAFSAAPAWLLKSWDRMPVPKPRARVLGWLADPIPPPVDDSPDQVDLMRRRTQLALNALHRQIDDELGVTGRD